jgi:hypothetical protein
MASITIINGTNWPINSAMIDSNFDVNSSWRNMINHNEFFVHSAAPLYPYNAHIRYQQATETLFESNWSRIAVLVADWTIDLIELGFEIVSFIPSGGSSAEVPVVVKEFKEGLKKLGNYVKDASFEKFYDMTSVKGMDKDLTKEVTGTYNDIYLVTGGFDFENMKFKPLELQPITEDEFEKFKKNNTYYEQSSRCNRIWYDSDGKPYYVNQSGIHIYNHDGDEYYMENGKEVKYDVKDDYYHPTNPMDPNSPTLTDPATKSTSGDWMNRVKVDDGRKAIAIEVQYKGGYGIVNARIMDDAGNNTPWTSDDMGDASFTTMSPDMAVKKDFPIKKLRVKEVEGFGIIDIRCICEGQEGRAGGDCGWTTNAPGEAGKTHKYTISIDNDRICTGLRGKKQAKFGLVDIRLIQSKIKS